MKKDGIEVSASLEDYLEAIYFLNGKDEGVRVTDLAIELNISKPSVNRAINNLKNQGLVEHKHYGSLKLTEEGLKIAENIASRHMMLKKFLLDVLGVEGERAEQEACLIEHYLSGDTIRKIEKHMKNCLKEKEEKGDF